MAAKRKGIALTVFCLALSLVCGCSCGEEKLWREEGKESAQPSLLTPDTFVELSQREKPAVVNISTSRTIKNHPNVGPFEHPRSFGGRNPFEDFFDNFFGVVPKREFKQKSLGSGFIINKEGYIITNAHVVDEVDEIKVTLANKKEFDAELVGSDKKTDIALIKIDSWKELPVAVLGDSDELRVGEWVLAIGNPFGLEHTVTSGIVSAKGRVIGAGPYDDYIQTDASINPGNSGGPLFNLRGEVVGINTAIIPEGQGIGFAVPINLAKDVLDDLKERGEVIRGWLGLVIQKITPGLAQSFGLKEPKGALVSEVVPGSPAEKAGFNRGDIVVSFENNEIDDYSDLSRLAAKTAPGSKVEVEVLRDGKKRTLTAVLETFPKDEKMAFMPGKVTSRLGMRVESITRELRRRYDLEDDRGVVVTKVTPGGPADEAKITPGTVVVEVNRKAIEDVDDFNKLVERAQKGQTLLLLIKRGTRTHYVTLKVP